MNEVSRGSGRLWSIVLAGGEGERVKPLVLRWLGRHKPKQYCAFVGTRSMFQHTVDRALRLTPPERTIAVIARSHRHEALVQLEERTGVKVLAQPANRDTAAGIFLPLTYVRAADPLACLVIYPSDHFVFPEGRFLACVQRAVWAAEWSPERLVLLGVGPNRVELEYGWIRPGKVLAGTVAEPVREVQTFVEKPSFDQAEAAMRNGALWNTLVLAANAHTLWRLGWQHFPAMMPLFERLGQAIGTSAERRVLRMIYHEMPECNFSSDLLQLVADHAAVIELKDVLWCDWGKPERIVETLQRIGKAPAFPVECLDRPFAPLPGIAEEGGLVSPA